MTERTNKCPTCGSIVRIVSADDDLGGSAVTSRYEPVQDEDLRAAIERLKDENVVLSTSRDHWKRHYTDALDRILGITEWARRGLKDLR